MSEYLMMWHAFSTALVLVLSSVLCWRWGGWFSATPVRRVSIFAWHTFFCFVYVSYAQANGGDAIGYYEAAISHQTHLGIGTKGVEYLTFLISTPINLSFTATAIVFSNFGTVGLLTLDAILRKICFNAGVFTKRLATIFIFMPSISFWSVSIGKDSISFLAACLAAWAFFEEKVKWGFITASIILMSFVRPHIGAILFIAVILSTIASKRITLRRRLILALLSCALLSATLPFVINYAGISEISSSSDAFDFIEERQSLNQDGGSSINISDQSFLHRLFSYLFYPLPHQATNPSSLLASIDNFLIMTLMACALTISLAKKVEQPRNFIFFASFSIITLVLLAQTTSNTGIAVRQKWMFLPMLAIIAFQSIVIKSAKNRFKL